MSKSEQTEGNDTSLLFTNKYLMKEIEKTGELTEESVETEEQTGIKCCDDVKKWHKFMPHLSLGDIKVPKRVTLTDALEHIMKNNINPDVKVEIDEQVFPCHRIVLRCYCAIFQHSLKQSQSVTLPSSKVPPLIFQKIYNWMTNSEALCPSTDILDMLIAVQFLKIDELERAINYCLSDKRNYDELSAFDCFKEAASRGMNDVALMMLSRVRKAFLLLIASPEFDDMHVDHVIILFNSNSIAVQTEIEMWYAVLYWLHSDFENRKIHMAKMISAVRFKLMPQSFLLNLATRLHELRPDLARTVQPKVMNAMLYIHEKFIDAHKDRKLSPIKRIRIKDPHCCYKNYLEDVSVCLTVDLFIKYLNRIQKMPENFIDRVKIVETVEIVETDKINESDN